mmetsp:Transcript_7209/g.10565  ORF Transcript_7209/g.10565 Transcript_7209/m.10565 type:complete len:342 (-) Transcript_7209:154-1179(-)|eukprot:CAMPEP_0194028404 /NCGR_PEP_ID=MMETSP0009_2-20130614/2378_1 /TAXON_ID=210454 /ORGANISM="Grammatophora oceanica, Strain CCMP 410" /LENGTH=341 /DNA_ID=CAMNT_0038667789 /DNA_START=58 /DNA_END=1083 /DNA_ORIENTATION=-
MNTVARALLILLHCAILLIHPCLTAEAPSHVSAWDDETGFYYSLAVSNDSPIFTRQSKYQKIEVHKSDHYGKILLLDGVIQLTEVDGDSYNEMMAHMAMMQHKNPKRVLVLGGGDGYVLSEVLKHDSVTEVHHVDLDGDVVDVCKEFFSWGSAWEDPRVTLHIEDGAAFVANAPSGHYDVIIQDSSDPWTYDVEGNLIPLPSGVLYGESHFENIHRILSPQGIFNFQAETFNIPSDLAGIIEWRKRLLGVGFQTARYGSLMISSYTGGQIGFLLCEKDPKTGTNMGEVRSRFEKMERDDRGTTYYQPKLQLSSFDLPLWVERRVYGQYGTSASVDEGTSSK